MNKLVAIVLFLSHGTALYAADLIHSPSLRLIDRGDGRAEWMSREDAAQIGKAAHETKQGLFNRCGGYFDLTDMTPIKDLSPLIDVTLFEKTLRDRKFTQGAYLNTALPLVDASRLQRTVTKLSSYPNRFYQNQTGVDSAQWIAEQFRTISKSRNDVKVELFNHSKWKQPSVIATITGKTKPNEIVVIGGHEDSINQGIFGPNANGKAPGADDNATGIATILETFQILVDTNFAPDRTLKFITYAAEEVGLLGSQEIANTFKNQKQNVVAVAQFDMTGFAGAGDQIVFMTDFTHPDLTLYSEKLVDTYVKIKWSVDQCGYACSDHASWNKAGYPAIMPFEATMETDNKAIHTPKDLISLLDFGHSLAFAKFAVAFVAELSMGQ